MPTLSLRKSAGLVALATAGLLLVPGVGMVVSDEINWGIGDFVAAAALLFGAGIVFVLAAPAASGRRGRIFLACAVLAAVALVWAELAVSLFH